MTQEEKKELFRLLVEVRNDLGGIQRLVGAMPGNDSHEGLLHNLMENASSLERKLFRELR